MKKYTMLAAVIVVSLQTMITQPAARHQKITAKPVMAYYLHDAVWLILKKITRLELVA